MAAKQAETTTDTAPRKMLSIEQVLELIPVGATTLWRLEKAGKFPRSTYISANRRAWYEDEVAAWQRTVDCFDPNRGRGRGRKPKKAREQRAAP